MASHSRDDDDGDGCCHLVQRRRQQQQQQRNPLLLDRLDQLIKARHVQLGGYEHDEREHLLEAARLERQHPHSESARYEVRLALEARALHARESAKYANLVALRRTLDEARRNLTLADLMRECSAEMQATLQRMPDVVALRERYDAQRDRVADDAQRLLLVEPLIDVPQHPPEEAPIVVPEEDVLAELERLRVPTHTPHHQSVAKVKLLA